MRAAAGREIEVADVDDAQFIALGGRKFAQAQLPCFFASHETDVDRAILEDDFVGHAFRRLNLLFAQSWCIEVDGAVVVRHVKGYGRNIEETNERRRQHVLAGVLLYVVAAAGGVDLSVDTGSGLEILHGLDVVNDAAVFRVGHFSDAEFRVSVRSIDGGDPSRVVDLAAAGGIERTAVENQGGTWGVEDFADFGVEVVKEGVVVVETVGHRNRLFNHRGHGGTRSKIPSNWQKAVLSGKLFAQDPDVPFIKGIEHLIDCILTIL